MQLAETASERALADEVRAFLSRASFRSADLPRALDDRMIALRRWQSACYDAGFVGRAWPSEFGGGGRPSSGAEAGRRWNRSSSTRNWRPAARPSS
jgi:alkylation response protein AidB-like acyl-CoA dehydrogenase